MPPDEQGKARPGHLGGRTSREPLCAAKARTSLALPLVGRKRSNSNGVALVIVLAFLVLLTGLVVAFFSQASSQLKISANSANQIQTEVFARGALDAILGDLKQEIAACSTVSSITVGGTTLSIYYPTTAQSAVPSRTGTNAPVNLLKWSQFGQKFFDESLSSGTTFPASQRAANLLSTGTSLNGRTVTLARWNKPLLLSKANSNTTNATPITTGAQPFTAPSWILVARSGTNPLTSGSDVIGRYAYCIYDEGGLLDMNVAGYPHGDVSALDIGRKGGLAFADLTQLPIGSSQNLSAAQAAAIVKWRNQFTLGSGPVGSNLSGTANAFVRSMLSNTSGFLKVSGTPGNTDKIFVSRQALLQFLLSGTVPGLSPAQAQNLLQYLGTFSRGLEQPSFRPDPARPKIVHPVGDDESVDASSTDPDVSKLLGNYRGGNNGWGLEDRINPAFAQIRATSAFRRNDGTMASIGEPLVKKRFALIRLAWITRNGTPPAGVTDKMIEDYFGLKWDSANRRWTYFHGITSGGSTIIGKLDEVQAAGREPDFFELLKASINAGSLGKAASLTYQILKPWSDPPYYQLRDTSLDYQVFQIGINLIDQYDSDSFPTTLWVNNPSARNGARFYGIEDLPYFYRLYYKAVPDADDLPSPQGNGVPEIKTDNSTVAEWVGFNCGTTMLLGQPEFWNPHDSATWVSSSARPQNFRTYLVTEDPDGMIATGSAAWKSAVRLRFGGRPAYYTTYTGVGWTPLYTGDQWPSTITTGTNDFDLRALPFAITGSNVATLRNNDSTYSTLKGPDPVDTNAKSPEDIRTSIDATVQTPRTLFGTELLFEVKAASLFREPTLLAELNTPAGSALQAGPGNRLNASPYSGVIKNASGGNPQLGFPLTRKPTRWIRASYVGSTGSTRYTLYTTNYMQVWEPYYTVRSQYKDPDTGQWVTYDERYMSPSGFQSAGYANHGAPMNYKGSLVTASGTLALPPTRWNSYDPRTSRFGHPVSFLANNLPSTYPPPIPDPNGAGMTDRQVGAVASDWKTLCRANAGMPGSYVSISSPAAIGWFNVNTVNATPNTYGGYNTGSGIRMGWLTENNPATGGQYYADADDIVRRASGAFAADGNYSGAQGIATAPTSNRSRPVVLNRPFRSVAEMSYAFRGCPWKNIDFFTPETGDAALLDVFCLNEPATPLTAGKFNLNTRQAPVLKAVLAGTIKDELNAGTTLATASELDAVASAIIARTSGTGMWEGPMTNMSDLAGKLLGKNLSALPPADSSIYSHTIPAGRKFGSASEDYAGTWSYTGLSALIAQACSDMESRKIQRFREAALRALADSGQCRVWNLLIDVIAQTGLYPNGQQNNLERFVVEGEKRYWLHVAIDRLTGEILDQQLEPVTEE